MEKAKRYNVIDDKSGEIVNIILWDGVEPYTPPEGTHLEEVIKK